VKQQLLADLIGHLSAEPGSHGWYAERDRLLAEVLAIHDTMPVYQSSVGYKLQRHFITGEVLVIKKGKETLVQSTQIDHIGKITSNIQVARGIVQEAMKTYPLEELRLYHGSKRIKDVQAWLDEA